MTPLERPICCLCDEPAVICECPDLHSGQEVAIPLVYRSEPLTRHEGLDLFATYIERHPATRAVEVRRFINDYAKEMPSVDQVPAATKQGYSDSERQANLSCGDFRLKTSSCVWCCAMLKKIFHLWEVMMSLTSQKLLEVQLHCSYAAAGVR